MAKKQPQTAEDIADWAAKSKENGELDPSDFVIPFETPDLTSKQRKVLIIESLPEFSGKTIKQKADLAGVSERHWHRFCHTEKFADYAIRLARRLYGRYALEITQAQIRKAIHGGQDMCGDAGTQQRILQQLEILDKDESRMRLNFGSMSDEDLLRLIASAVKHADPINPTE